MSSLRALRTSSLVSVLGCLSLIASLGVIARPAGAAVQANPDLTNACGLDFALVIDRSGSVSSDGASDTVRNAAKAFLTALVDTGSKVSLTSFARTATVDKTATALTTANLADLKDEIDDLHFGDYTNWEDGLIKAQSTFGGFTDKKPDLLVIITDGNPNRWIRDNDVRGSGSDFDQEAQDQAVVRADEIKKGGTHMFALGVQGTGNLNTSALQAISGPDEWPAKTFAVGDWTKVKSFSELQSGLLKMATELCGGTVVVQKLVDGQAAPGFRFSASGGKPNADATNADGKLIFDWDSAQTQATNLTETPQPGYRLDKSSCLRNSNAYGKAITGGWNLEVGPLDTIYCTFNNHKLTTLIDVKKTASPTSVIPGGSVTYTYDVTNPGEAALSDVTVTDDKCGPSSGLTRTGGDTNGNGLLDPTETWKYSCSANLLADTTNTATALGTPPVGERVKDTATASVDVVTPGLDIVKTGPAQAREGALVTYDFAVKNTGAITLSNVTVTDNVLGTIGTILSLPPGATETLHKQYTIPASTADVANIARACVSAIPAIGFCDEDSHTLDVLHPAIQVVKTVDKPVIIAGTTVVYSYSVTNPGDIALSGVKVTDNKCGPSSGLTRTGATGNGDNLLDPGEIWAFTCSAPISIDTVNTATAEGTPPAGTKVIDTDTITVDVVRPGLTVDKTGPAQALEGDRVIYRFAVTNTGDVALTAVSVDDTVLGHIDTIPALGAGITVTLEKAYTILPGTIANVTNAAKACVTGAPGLGNTELCSPTDSHTLDVIHPAILVDKTVDRAKVTAGGAVVYSYAVTNPGDVALSGVTVTDDKCAPVTFASGDTGGDQKLSPGERWLFSCSATIAADTNNTALATGIPPVGLPVTGTDTVFVDVVNPLLDIAKTGPAGAREGDTVTYNFAVSNIGDVPLENVVVDDDILGPIGTIADLAVGATVTLHKDYKILTGHPADVVNLASACVTGAPGRTTKLCDSAPHTLDVLHPAIHVAKTVDRAVITAGSSVTYTYAVANTGDTPLQGVSVTDDKCSPVTFSGGDTDRDNVLDGGETWTYRCSATLNLDTLNTAVAKGTPPVGPDVTGTATSLVDVVNPFLHVDKKAPAQVHEGDAITYTFTVANTGDVVLTNLTVMDDVLGPIGTIESLAPGTSVDITRPYTVPTPQIGDVVNTVSVCTAGPAPGSPANGKPLCDTDIHASDVLHPAVTISKTADPVTVTGSGPVTFTYVVTNTGDAPLAALTVTDDILGLIGNVPSLGVGLSATLTKTVTIGANSALRNVGTVSGSDQIGRTVVNDATAVITLVTPEAPPDVLGVAITKPAPPLAPEVQDAVLPRTGSEIRKRVFLALTLMGLGMVALLAGRRRWTRRRAL